MYDIHTVKLFYNTWNDLEERSRSLAME